MKYNSYGDVKVKGELGARCALLSSRLEAPMYRPPEVFRPASYDWPGDWEGRIILALCCQSQITGRQPSFLDEIIDELPSHLNGKGYFGADHGGLISEQQLSGHSWLLRGLCEYYEYRRDTRVTGLIDGIVRGLFLPAAGRYASYPVLPEQRANGGGMSGSEAGTVDGWIISTDTGCAYMPLDGLTHAYEILSRYAPDAARDEALGALIDEMLYHFFRIPFIEVKLQTHATLSGCRGALRRYAQTGDETLIEQVKRVFGLYEEHGMTRTYANENWFSRPEWTEPCAIIDSFMVGSQLFAYTDDPHYAEISQLILYNGLLHAQRPNGGFGCDTCATDGALAVHGYEAYWCCTMRGGEGLAAAAAYSVTDDGVIINPVSVTAPVRGRRLEIVSDYPHGGSVRIRYEGGGRLYLFVPHWISSVKCDHIGGCDEHYVYIDVPDGETVSLTLELRLWQDESRVYDGPLMLASEEKQVRAAAEDVIRKNGGYEARGHRLTSIDGTYLLSEAAAMAQILYVELS